MLIGLCAVAILFPICLFLWWAEVINIVPWAHDAANIKGIFICVSSVYLPMFPCVFAYICHRNGAFSKSGNRLIGTFVVGASLGLFVSAIVAIFGEDSTLRQFHTESFERTLCGRAPSEIWEPAQTLFSKAEVLSMLMPFVNNCMRDAVEFAIIALLIVLLYDKISSIKQRNTKP